MAQDRDRLLALINADGGVRPATDEKFREIDRRRLLALAQEDETRFRGVGNMARGVGQAFAGDLPAGMIAAGGMAAQEFADTARVAELDRVPSDAVAALTPGFAQRRRAVAPEREALTGGMASLDGARPAAIDEPAPPKAWEGREIPGGDAPITRAAVKIADQWRREVAEAMPYERSTGMVAGFVEDTLRSAPTTAAGAGLGLAVGAVTRNPAAGITAGSIFMALADASGEMEEVYKEGVASGLSEAESVRRANQVGAVYAPASALLERIGLGKILSVGKNIPGKNRLVQAAKRVADAGATEFLTEAAQTAAAETIKAVVTEDWAGVKELARSDELFRAGLSGAFLGGGIRAGVEALNPANYRSGKAFLADAEAAAEAGNLVTTKLPEGQAAPDAPGQARTAPDAGGPGTPGAFQPGTPGVPAGRGASQTTEQGAETLLAANNRQGRLVPAEELDAPRQAVVAEWAQRGVQVGFVDGAGPMDLVGANTGPGVVVLDAALDSDRAMQAVAWHEGVHDLERREPGIWAGLAADLDALAPEMMQAARERYAARWEAAGKGEIDADRLASEAPANVAEVVVDAILAEQAAPGTIGRLLTASPPSVRQKLVSAIQALLRKFGLYGQATAVERAAADLAKARDLGGPEALRSAAVIMEAVGQLRPFVETGAPVSQNRDATAQDPRSEPVEAGSVSEPVAPATPARPEREARAVVRDRKGSEFSNRGIRRRLLQIVESSPRTEQEFQDEVVDGGEQYGTDLTFSFSGPLPTEIRQALQGEPANIRMLFKGNTPGAQGADVMGAIGADAMVERARRMIQGRDSRVEEIIDTEGALDALSPDGGLLATIRRLRGSLPASEIVPYEVVDNPAALPEGATFRIQDSEFVVSRGEQGTRAVSMADPRQGFNLDGVESMPVDARTLNWNAGAAVPEVDLLADIPFSIRGQNDESQSDAARFAIRPEDNQEPRPRDFLRKPITGPTGAKIVAYRWMSEMRDGMFRDRRVSDWSQAQTSEPTGRSIVHVFWVEQPGKGVSIMGVGAAQKALGMPESRLRTIAEREKQAQVERERREEQTAQSLMKAASASPAEASRKWRTANNPYKMVGGATAENVRTIDEAFARTAVLTDGERYIRLRADGDDAAMLQERGWTAVPEGDARFAVRPEPRGPAGRDLLGRPIFEPATGRQQTLPLETESPIAREDRERRERQARENGDDPGQTTMFAARDDQPDLPGATPIQTRITPEGRPDLANPGRTDEVRGFVNAVDQIRNAAGQPTPTTFDEIEARADAMLARDPRGVEGRVRDRVQRGENLTAEETVILARAVNRQAQGALRTENAADLTDAVRTAWQWRQSGTIAARALGVRRDREAGPNQRLREALMDAILMPSPRVRAKLQRIAEQLAQDDIAPTKRAELEQQQGQLFDREGQRVAKVRETLAKDGLDPRIINEVTMRDRKFAADVARAVQKTKTTVYDRLFEYRLTAILSSPRTHFANIAGNAAMVATQYGPYRFAESLVGSIRGDLDGPTLKEYTYLMTLAFEKMGSAFHYMAESWSQNRQVFDEQILGEAYESDLVLKFKGEEIRRVGSQYDNPFMIAIEAVSFRALTAQDQFFKSYTATMQAHALAYRQAKREGLRGDEATARIDEILQDSTSNIWKESLEEGRAAVFQDAPDKLTRSVMQLRREFPVLAWFLPFVTTPSRLLYRGLELTVLGTLPLTGRSVATGLQAVSKKEMGGYQGRPRQLNRDIARAIISIGFVGAVLALREDDEGRPRITGTRTLNWRDAEEQARTAPAMSIRLGNNWYSYARIEPIATTLALTVDLIEKSKETQDVTEALGESWKSFARVMAEKSYLQTFGDLFGAVADAERSATLVPDLLRRTFVTPWIPNIIKDIPRGADESIRDRRMPKDTGFWQRQGALAAYESFPLEAWAPPARYDLWGRPMTKDTPFGPSGIGAFLWRAGVPINVSEANLHPMDLLIHNFNDKVRRGVIQGTDVKGTDDSTGEFHPRPFMNTFAWDGVDYVMDPEQYQEFVRTTGEKISARLLAMDLNIEDPSRRDIERIETVFTQEARRARRDAVRSGLARPFKESLRNKQRGVIE